VLLGEIVAAPELLASGFLHQIVEPAEIDPAAEALCRRAAENAPLTTSATKEMLRRMRYAALPDVEDLIATVYGSADFQRGVANFLSGNKTLPDWKGD
jgi:enoyl-CoA hydratase/carnithine racemase